MPECSKKNVSASPFRVWASFDEFVPYNQPCWASTMQLMFDDILLKYSNKAGVYVGPESFGSTRAFEYLDWYAFHSEFALVTYVTC